MTINKGNNNHYDYDDDCSNDSFDESIPELVPGGLVRGGSFQDSI